jgi:hypothetical protein
MNRGRGQLTVWACSMCLTLFATIVAQDRSAEKTTPPSKKTSGGLEVRVLAAKAVEDFDPINRVRLFRMGSCPPGVAMPGIKIEGGRGRDVIIVQLGLNIPPDYRQSDFPMPLLLDAGGKTYSSNNMMEPSKKLLAQIQTTGEQLKCEIPFELPAATQITKLKYDNVIFDLKLGSPSQQ